MKRYQSKYIRTYIREYVCLTVSKATGRCYIDYGYEMLKLSRSRAAIVLRRMHRDEHIHYKEYGETI